MISIETLRLTYSLSEDEIIALLDDAATQYPTTIRTIRESLDQVGPVAAARGWPLKDVLDALGNLYQRAYGEGKVLMAIPTPEGTKHEYRYPPSAGIALHRLIATKKIKSPEDINDDVLFMEVTQTR